MSCEIILCTTTVSPITCPVTANLDLVGAGIVGNLTYVAPGATVTSDGHLYFGSNVAVANNGLLFKLSLPNYSGDYNIDLVIDGVFPGNHLIFVWMNSDGFFAVQRNPLTEAEPFTYAWGPGANFTAGMPLSWLSQFANWGGVTAAPTSFVRNSITVSSTPTGQTSFTNWMFSYPQSAIMWGGNIPTGMGQNGYLAHSMMEVGVYRAVSYPLETFSFSHVSTKFTCVRPQSPSLYSANVPASVMASMNKFMWGVNVPASTINDTTNVANGATLLAASLGVDTMNVNTTKVGDWPLSEITQFSLDSQTNILQSIPVSVNVSSSLNAAGSLVAGVAEVQDLQVTVQVMGTFPNTSANDVLYVVLTDDEEDTYFAFGKGDISQYFGSFIWANGTFIQTPNQLDIRNTDHSMSIPVMWDMYPPTTNPNTVTVTFGITPSGMVSIRAFHGGQVAYQTFPAVSQLDVTALRVQLYRGDPSYAFAISDLFIESVQRNAPVAFYNNWGSCQLSAFSSSSCMGFMQRQVLCTQRQPNPLVPTSYIPVAVPLSNCYNIPPALQPCQYQPLNSQVMMYANVTVHHVSGSVTKPYRPDSSNLISWTRVPNRGPLDVIVSLFNVANMTVRILEFTENADIDGTMVFVGVQDLTLPCSAQSTGTATFAVTEEFMPEQYVNTDSISMRSTVTSWP